MISDNILRGRKVRLTAVTKEDLPTITRWYEDSGFSRLFDGTPAAPRNQEQWQAHLEKQSKDKDVFLFAIRALDDETLLGTATLDGILWNHQNGWLSIGLGDRTNWGKGYGWDAMKLVLKFAFDELNLHRVQLTVFSYNKRARALYERLGFTREGIFREHLSRDGRRHDMILYGMLRREWEQNRDLY